MQSEKPSKLNQISLYNRHVEMGGKMCPFAGYMMPINYTTSIIQEHNHTRSATGLFDVSHMGAIFIDDENAATELEKLIPCDIKELLVGQTKYSLLLNENGGIVDDLLISRIEKGFLIVVNAGNKHEDLKYLQTLPIKFRPEFERNILALQGPKAHEVIQAIIPEATSLKFMNVGKFHYDGEEIYISRTGYTGEDGFEILVGNKSVEKIFEKLLSNPEVLPIGLGARDSLRLEAGLCLHGHDISPSITPTEANLNWVVGKRRRLDAGFAGASVVLEQIKDGASKKLVGLLPESKAIAREGATIHLGDGTKVGVVTSGTHSPTLNKAIAMGYVDTEHLNSELYVNIRNQNYPVKIQKLPFVQTKYYKG